MTEIKVGDKFKFRTDLIVGRSYGGITFLESMKRLKGKQVTIKSANKHGLSHLIHLNEDREYDFCYSSAMLETDTPVSIKGLKVGDKVTVRQGLTANSNVGGVFINDEMYLMGGQVLTVACIAPSGNFDVLENIWRWSPESCLKKKNVGTKTTPIKNSLFKVGDFVISSDLKKGVGEVKSLWEKDEVEVKFPLTSIKLVYNRFTGKRWGGSGESDVISLYTNDVKPTFNVVFVRLEDGDKKYTYLVPNGIQLKEGDKVFVPMRTSSLRAICTSDSVLFDEASFKMLCHAQDIPQNMVKTITGRAVETTTYECKPF